MLDKVSFAFLLIFQLRGIIIHLDQIIKEHTS